MLRMPYIGALQAFNWRLLLLLRPLPSIRVTVTGVMPIVVVIAMTVVATERFEIDFVQNDSQEIIVDAAGSG
jgi:hypothetical protein